GKPAPGGPSRPAACSSSSDPSRTPNGSARAWRAITGASSSPGQTWRTSLGSAGKPTGLRWHMRPACPACSPLATFAGDLSSELPRLWAKGRSPSRSSTGTWKACRRQQWEHGNPMAGNTVRYTEPDPRKPAGRPAQAGAAGSIRPLVPGMRWLLYTAAVLVLLAGFQLFVLTGRTGKVFAWTIAHPLGAAFLCGSYWARVSIEALAGRQAVWANARIAVPTVFVFTVLTLAATLMHLNQFHLGSQFAVGTRIVTWAWLAVYVLVPVLMLIVLVV